MQRDIRDTALFQEARRIFEEAYRPGEGFISDIADLQRSSDTAHLLFTGTLVEHFDRPSTTRICEMNLATGAIQVLTSGPNSDRSARISPDGTTIAFLSDRGKVADFQLFFLDAPTRTVSVGPAVDGWIEYLEWSPDGGRILLGVGGHGAELSSGQGAYKTDEIAGNEPSWMPHVIGAPSDTQWRKVWILDVATGALWCASIGTDNIWGGDVVR